MTSYNRPDALEAVLLSLRNQTIKPNQVIVADDGSAANIREICARYSKDLPLQFTWQPDNGFRAARSRNLAISLVDSEYLIMIDGDCMAPPSFIASHLALSEKNKLIAGARALLTCSKTDFLLDMKDQSEIEGSFKSKKFIHLPLGKLRDINKQDWKTVRTCNMSLHTDDILRVGGFDEAFTEWGYEDSDLVIRLIKAGLEVRNGRFATCVNHLYHSTEKKSERNKSRLDHLDSRHSYIGNKSILIG